MAGKDSDYRIFVGGLSWDVTERQLDDAFGRFGKIIDTQIMLERDTGRPRGFGFITFSDRRGMEEAIREMHGTDLGERVISVNRAQPKLATDSPDRAYGGSYPSGGRGRGGDRSMGGSDECFKCGRSGHWARDCPSAGGGGGGGGRGGGHFSSSRPRFGGRGDRYIGRDEYLEDRYDGGRFEERERYDTGRDTKYGGSRTRYTEDRYIPSGGDRFVGDRYGVVGRYAPPPSPPPPLGGYEREREYDREVSPPRRGGVRYGGGGGGGRGGGGGGPARYEGRSYRERDGPYDRPRRGGGRPSSFDY